jgi:hypothetical protein
MYNVAITYFMMPGWFQGFPRVAADFAHFADSSRSKFRI